MLNKIKQFFSNYEIIIRKKNIEVGDYMWFVHSEGYGKFKITSIQDGYALGVDTHKLKQAIKI